MALVKLYGNSLVYSFLLKNYPEFGASFTSFVKAKPVPPDLPSLENIIHNLISQNIITKEQLSENFVTKGKQAKSESEDSSTDSSDSEGEGNKSVVKNKLPVSRNTVTQQATKVNSKADRESSDSNSDSDDNTIAKKNLHDKLPNSQHAISQKGNLTQKVHHQTSSSSDDSDSEEENPKSKNLNKSQKKSTIDKTSLKHKEDSDALADVKSSKSALTTSNLNTAISKHLSKFSESTSSESESEKNLVVSLSKKMSTPMSNSNKTKTSNQKPQVTPIAKFSTLKQSPGSKKVAESSDDSSSDDDDDGKLNLTQKTNTPINKINQKINPTVANKNKTGNDDSSDSSDSDDSEPTNKNMKVAPMSKPTLLKDSKDIKNANKKPQVISSAKFPVSKPSQGSKVSESSDDSSSDDDDDKAAPNSVLKSGTEINKSHKVTPVANIKSKTAVDESSDSSDSDDSDSKPENNMKSGPVPKPPFKNSQKLPAISSAKFSALKSSPALKKAAESSDDSSSDDDGGDKPLSGVTQKAGLELKKPTHKVTPIVPNFKNKTGDDESSDSSDTDDSDSKTGNKNTKLALSISKSTPLKKLIDAKSSNKKEQKISTAKLSASKPSPGSKKAAESSDSSSDSSDSDSKPANKNIKAASISKPTPLRNLNNIKSANQKSQVIPDTKPSAVKPSPGSKKVSESSDDSSSDDDSAAAALNSTQKVATLNKSSQKVTPVTPISKVGNGESSDSSDSDDSAKPMNKNASVSKSSSVTSAKKSKKNTDVSSNENVTSRQNAVIQSNTKQKHIQTSLKQGQKRPNHDVSSSEDSSDSDDKTRQSVASKALAQNKVNATSVGKSITKKESSTSSSDSEDEPDKPTAIATKSTPSTFAKQVIQHGNKPSGSSKRKAPDSDSSSDSEDEKPAMLSAKKIDKNKGNSIKLANDKGGMESSSSEDEDEQPEVTKSSVKLHATPKSAVNALSKVPASSQQDAQDSSDSSSSDTEDEPSKTAKVSKTSFSTTSPKSAFQKQTKPQIVSNQDTDSSSESDSNTQVQISNIKNRTQVQVKSISKVNIAKGNVKNESSSSDESDEEIDKSATTSLLKPAVTSLKVPSKSGSKMANLGKFQQEETSDSDSSSDENSTQPQKKLATPVPVQSKGNVKSPITSATPSKKSQLVGINSKNSKKSDSSSDSSDEENETERNISTSVSSNITIPSKGKVPANSSESSSDSEDDQHAKQKSKASPVVPRPVHSQGSVKRKQEESTDASSSDSGTDAKNTATPQANDKNVEIKQQKKRVLNSDLNASHDLKTPKKRPQKDSYVASDSTKKRRGSSPFRRVKNEDFQIDPRLVESSKNAKHELPTLGSARGKQFRHEKTKKKKGKHSFGRIDTSVKSITFD